MSVMRLEWAGTAGTTNNNLVAGEKFEFLARPSVVKLYVTADVVVNGSIEVDFSLGNVVVGDNLVPAYTDVTVTDQGPDRDKHLLARAVGRGGDRIQVRLRSTGAANCPTRALIEIDEIA